MALEACVTTFDAFVDQCWDDHAADPAGVARRLNEALPQVADDDGLARLAMLAHHVFGEHLGQWPAGLQFLQALAAVDVPGDAGRASLARCRVSLELCAGRGDARAELSAGDACRATVMAACSLAPHDAARSAALLQAAVAAAGAFADDDPAVRTLAAFGNNIAGTLQDKPGRSPAETRLMLDAAEIARSAWARAGGWREVERAEYRLSVCQLAAGQAEQAWVHARRCDAIVRDHGAEPLELFFAAEALALSAHLTGRSGAWQAALAVAEASFAAIDPADQAWCRPTLEKLRAAA